MYVSDFVERFQQSRHAVWFFITFITSTAVQFFFYADFVALGVVFN